MKAGELAASQRGLLALNRDYTHPIKEDVKKKFFSVPLEGTRGW
jgi:hypothetical protein